MRVRSRWVLGMCGLAISAPAGSTAWAQNGPYAPGPGAVAPMPGGGPAPAGPSGMLPTWGGPTTGSNYAPAGQPASGGVTATAAPSMAAHHHHGLLGRRHCVDCQRAYVKKHDGVDIPPPPDYPGGTMMPGQGAVMAGAPMAGETVIMAGDPAAGGHAVVGGPGDDAGYAVVNDGMPAAEPAPVGLARGSMGAPMMDPRMAAAMPRPGTPGYDPSVMRSSVPPPPSLMDGPGHNRPHVISHMLHIPVIGKRHEERVDRRRERHAAEAYGDSKAPVTELPASTVYGRR